MPETRPGLYAEARACTSRTARASMRCTWLLSFASLLWLPRLSESPSMSAGDDSLSSADAAGTAPHTGSSVSPNVAALELQVCGDLRMSPGANAVSSASAGSEGGSNESRADA
eukprot:scaffold93016_cov66-Phaeocystis_antarctica.AAC.3